MFLSVNSITTSGANLVIKGKGASGTTVKVIKSGATLGQDQVNNSGDWEITIPAAGNNSFTVEGGGKVEAVAVSVPTGGGDATVTTGTSTGTIPITAQAATAP
jgi:hypothetical protein